MIEATANLYDRIGYGGYVPTTTPKFCDSRDHDIVKTYKNHTLGFEKLPSLNAWGRESW